MYEPFVSATRSTFVGRKSINCAWIFAVAYILAVLGTANVGLAQSSRLWALWHFRTLGHALNSCKQQFICTASGKVESLDFWKRTSGSCSWFRLCARAVVTLAGHPMCIPMVVPPSFGHGRDGSSWLPFKGQEGCWLLGVQEGIKQVQFWKC